FGLRGCAPLQEGRRHWASHGPVCASATCQIPLPESHSHTSAAAISLSLSVCVCVCACGAPCAYLTHACACPGVWGVSALVQGCSVPWCELGLESHVERAPSDQPVPVTQ